MSQKRKIQTTLSFVPKPRPLRGQEPPKYLILDTSYTVFQKFHATKTWYKLAHPHEPIDDNPDWYENIIFRTKFRQNYLLAIEKLAKSHYIRNNKIVFACDCSRRSIWRMKYLSSYKQNREGKYGKSKNQINIAPFFKCVYTELIPHISKKFGCLRLKFDTLEADDIIALSKLYFRTHVHPQASCVIVTSDFDLLQLRDDRTHLRDLKNRDLCDKSLGSPSLDLNVKILCGDKSDNITGCFTRCGKKTALRLLGNPLQLEQRFEREGVEARELFKRNRLLMDLEQIPVELQTSFFEYIKQELQAGTLFKT